MLLPGTRPLSLIIAVANTGEDQLFARELQKHLQLLSNAGQLTCWFLDQLPAGSYRTQKIEKQCQQADLFLLLLSPDFWVSPDCRYINKLAQERQREGLARVYQIKVRAVRIEEQTFQSSKFLPLNDRPINQWPDRDQAWTTVVGQISAVVTRARQPVFLAIDPSLPMYNRIVDTLDNAAIPFLTRTALQDATLMEVMRQVSSVVVLFSEETWDDQQIEALQKLAAVRLCPFIIVWDSQQPPDTELPGYWRGRPFVWIGSPSFSRDLLCQIQKRLNSVPRQDRPRNPYKGLRAFQPEDAGNFFGRTIVIEKLLETLKSLLEGDQARLLTVVGRSGVGKSSVVLAGLLPHLQAREIAGSVHWEVIKPGDNPLDALMIPLAYSLPEVGMQKIADDLKEGKDDIFHEYIQRIAKKLSFSTVVLVVDQLEELFLPKIISGVPIDVRHRFITLLSKAVTVPHGPLLVVLIMRADFRERFMADFPEFYRMLDAHQLLIVPMTREEMSEAIERPAFNASVQFEKNLARDMMLELQGQVSALPMLQVVLEHLFDARKGDLMTRATYEQIGGVKGAIKQLAEEAYGRLPDEKHRLVLKKIFRHLVAQSAGEQGIIRQRMPLTELIKRIKLADPLKERTVRECIAPFVNAQLLTTSEVEHVPMIEVSHEAILQEWPLLETWIGEWDGDLRLEQALNSRIEQWQQRQAEMKSLLYRGRYRKTMQQWAIRNDPDELQETFLRESRQQAKQSMLRVVRSVLVVVAIIVASLGGGVWWQASHAFSPNRVVTLQDDGSGSLRWCLATAQAGSTITIDPTLKGIITLKSTLIISKPITVKGPGENVLSLRSLGVTAGLIIDAIGIVSLSDLGFVQGSPSSTPVGSTTINIVATSTVHLNHVAIAHNHKVGIVNAGTLTLANSTLLDNSPSGLRGASMGGIDNSIGGTLTITNTAIIGNASSTDNATGVGGIFNDGMMTITNSKITGNTSHNSPSIGGIFNDGTLTISGTTISGNSSFSDTGGTGVGGVRNSGGRMIISDSTISSNSSSAAAGTGVGGVASESGSITAGRMIISDSTISNNSSSGVSGTHIGGVFSGAGTTTIANSTITGNASLGTGTPHISGVLNSIGTLTIANTTISHNSSSDASSIYTNGGGKTMLVFCTVIENATAGIVVSSTQKEMRSSMLVQNTILLSTSVMIDDPFSVFQSNGYNLVDAANTSFFQQTGDRIIQHPATLFAPGDLLESNGGATQTLKIRMGSEAYNTIPVQACRIQAIYNAQTQMYADQRSQPRPGRGKTQCDVGAYEMQL